MSDIFTQSAKHVLTEAMGDMRSAIEGAPPDALNWRPAGDDTNSIAVLAIHVMNSTRWWLSTATGAPLPHRNREEEFIATAPTAATLLATVDEMHADCVQLLNPAEQVDWSAKRATRAGPDDDGPSEVPAAWALLHALTHLREHTGQLLLTRQLWDAGKR